MTTDRLLREKAVREMTGGITRQTLWNWVKRGWFPEPKKLPNGKNAWEEQTVRQWIADLPRETEKA